MTHDEELFRSTHFKTYGISFSYISFWLSTDGMLSNNRPFMEAQYGTILQADMHSFKAFTVVWEQMF